PGWEDTLRSLVRDRGRLLGSEGIDYFVFPRGLYSRVPPFAIGRTAWDNWLLLEAWRGGAAVVDATTVITAGHFNHECSHAGGRDRVWTGPEALRNRELYNSVSVFSLFYASHVLTEGGLARKTHTMIGPYLDLLEFRYPALMPASRALRGLWRALRV